MVSASKHWCFTLNNYTDEEQAKLQSLWAEKANDVQYLVFGREEGEEGTKHLQGYISFTKRKSFASAKRSISDRAHVERTLGKPNQAADYCKKDADFEEYGTLPGGQGNRSDLAECVKAIKAGKSIRELADEFPGTIIRYGNGIQRLRVLHRIERTGPPEIWTLWGKTGTGKTRRVWEFADIDSLWVHPGDRWFDGYDGHLAVLFDDFDGSWFKLSYLLRLLDRYPMTVPIKGGFTYWVPRTIYITSNLPPKEWYKNAEEEHRRALMRRLTEFGTIQECHHY